MDYLQTKHPVLSASGRHEDLEELLTKALSTCPTYAVIMKVLHKTHCATMYCREYYYKHALLSSFLSSVCGVS